MSAISQRGKRKTAGRRMNALVGKAQEEDDEFWGHDTWAEGEDSGNESFRDSDEDSALKKDEFDSDFDDSESDNEDEERAAGEEEERELKRQERSKAKGKGYMDLVSNRPTKGRGKRVVGDGMNAGIVLNFPPSAGGAPLPTPAAAPLAPGPAAVAPKTPPKKAGKRITMASTRTKRSGTFKRLRESTTKVSAQSKTAAQKTTKTGTNKKSGKRMFTQEELLMEAAHKTEPENLRWLLARKRIKDIEDQDKEMMSLRDKNKGPVIQKYHSKRACLKTLTFPDMDSVPEILTRKKVVLEKPKQIFCVITGKPARYKDPKTNLGYFDLAAFKELRRRLEAKEPLDQRKKAPTKPKPKPKPAEATSTAQQKPKVSPKPVTTGANPTEVTPSTPKPTGTVTGPNATGGPNLPALSPSGRRSSPRARKPSEKMRENIGSNPQLSNLVKLGFSSPSKSSLAIPDTSTTSNSNLSGLAPKPSPSNGNGKTPAMPQTAPKQNTNTSASAGAKVRNATPTTKSKTATAAAKKTKPGGSKQTAKAATTKTTEPSAGEPKPAERVYAVPTESKQTAKGQQYLTQSQLIMQVIQDYNKQHPEVKE